MGRQKKIISSAALNNSEGADLTPAQAAAPAVGRQKIVTTTVVSKPFNPAEEEIAQTTEEDDEEGILDSDEPLFKEIEEEEESQSYFLSEGKGDAEHTIHVYKILKPQAGARFANGGQIFCGQVDDTPNYLADIQQFYGGGTYRLQAKGFYISQKTGKRQFGILKSETVNIAAPPKPLMPESPQALPNPQAYTLPFISPVEAQPAPAPAPVDPIKQFREFLNLQKLMREAIGEPQQQANPTPFTAPAPVDPEVAFLQVLANDDSVVEKLSRGVIGKLMGKGDAGDADPWADVVKEAIKSGQGAELLRVGIEAIFNGFSGLFPQRGSNNGMATMGAPALANNAQPEAGHRENQADGHQGAHRPSQLSAQSAEVLRPGDAEPTSDSPVIEPTEELLIFVINQCARNAPVQAVFSGITRFADQLREDDPMNGEMVDFYVEQFAEMSATDALAFVAGQVPGGEQVAALPHAAAWTQELQERLKKNLEESDADQPD